MADVTGEGAERRGTARGAEGPGTDGTTPRTPGRAGSADPRNVTGDAATSRETAEARATAAAREADGRTGAPGADTLAGTPATDATAGAPRTGTTTGALGVGTTPGHQSISDRDRRDGVGTAPGRQSIGDRDRRDGVGAEDGNAGTAWREGTGADGRGSATGVGEKAGAAAEGRTRTPHETSGTTSVGTGRTTGEGVTAGARTGTGDTSRGGDSPLLPHEESDKLAKRLQQAVGGFIDEPRASVEEADHVLEEVAARFTDAITQRRRALRSSWQTSGESKGATADTEQLRLALRDYREMAERLLHS
ncbi:hypothetical protein ACIPJS_25515 [Streptomyces sp. NPDC086783]|uniref:hypothetical protein n=1 Tax=Streptomyces sp. NPDC086783 TaxID=3365758 RepID=UPI00381F91BF